ncbi:MAG: peptidoglycan editing factor PgeF [Neisseria sp.]|nr:peptidoglycan editing factor PgeF [Neisseria sp.]
MKTLDQLFQINNGASEESPFLHADWPAPPNVKTLITTRNGGVSGKPWNEAEGSKRAHFRQYPFSWLNVGAHVGDDAAAVAENRARVEAATGLPLGYLNQVHGVTVVDAADSVAEPLEADASVNSDGRAACAVMTADCLPVLFCDRAGSVVAAAHAGWRSLAGGVLQNTVAAMKVSPLEIMAYLGPAIGPDSFEVGEDVKQAFCAADPDAEAAFEPLPPQDGQAKYLADIYRLARRILHREGITQIYGGGRCTLLEWETFFSYRRDGQTGRMVSAVWLEK